jgi:hypothetical protein
MRAPDLEFKTPLSPAECIRCLKEDIRPLWIPFGNQRAVGWIGRDAFSISIRTGYRNSFREILRGKMTAMSDGGTQVLCSFGMSRFVLAFLFVWFGMLIAMSVNLISSFSENWQAFTVPLAMFGAGIGIVVLGRFFARRERANLVEFIRLTLDAKEVPSLDSTPRF